MLLKQEMSYDNKAVCCCSTTFVQKYFTRTNAMVLWVLFFRRETFSNSSDGTLPVLHEYIHWC